MKKIIPVLLIAVTILIITPHDSHAMQNSKTSTEQVEGFWQDLWNDIVSIFKIVKHWVDEATKVWKPVWGEYREAGEDPYGPYTMIDNRGGKDIATTINEVRQRIKNNIDLSQDIYLKIYEVANGGVSCSNASDVCGYATRAKNAVLVYIIGLNSTGTGYLSDGARNDFLNRALDDLNHFPTDWTWFIGQDNLQYRSKEIIMGLQAYDMLKNAWKVCKSETDPGTF